MTNPGHRAGIFSAYPLPRGSHCCARLYRSTAGKGNSDLDEADKQLVSNLATLASGLAGNIVSGNASGTTAGAQAGKNAVENNALSVPAPIPVPIPGVPVSPGDKVIKDANDKMASSLDDVFDAIDKATQCSFGGACSSDDIDQETGPNVGKNLTDDEKAEYGGTGTGTPGGHGPEDEENARKNESTGNP
ncbi:VENN motif pre-toxin domain-containing protein [Lelliottia amnigena]|uniref:VENN motif pre-toxin domain-containing protein n=1 Tax=Lelliottia amnigena TaxID=61646 RepID=UPI001ED94E13|nr:VENN motif pre-toxin domain-containing protein [Lelliottia amnigena]